VARYRRPRDMVFLSKQVWRTHWLKPKLRPIKQLIIFHWFSQVGVRGMRSSMCLAFFKVLLGNY
jgi:hypothetical protein